MARSQLANLLYLGGRAEQATELYRELVAEQPQIAEYRVRLAILLARQGVPGAARDALQWLETLQGEALAQAIPPEQLAYWGSVEGCRALMRARLLAQLGDRERAVGMLRTAMGSGLAHGYLHLHDDPDFDSLRGHASFERLLRPRE